MGQNCSLVYKKSTHNDTNESLVYHAFTTQYHQPDILYSSTVQKQKHTRTTVEHSAWHNRVHQNICYRVVA